MGDDLLAQKITETAAPCEDDQQHNYAKHDVISCPLCAVSFVCLCNRAADCPCAQVHVTRDEAEWIGWQTGNDCVCRACLMLLRGRAREAMA